MRYSDFFIKTNKAAKEFDSINATYLQKAGFIDQTMAGVYTFLPLGLRVLTKIEDVIREEMNEVGAELLMPALSPKSLWETTNRLDGIDVLFSARGANELSKTRNDAEYILNPTHEELISEIALRLKPSYKDLPFAVFQIQTKFRNEVRPKSGLLRGREFRMKDLYSFHASEEDFQKYYDSIKDVYMKIFDRLGLGKDTVIALASGGDFTKEYSHEFNTRCESGEDTVYYDAENDIYYNEEVVPDEVKNSGESFKVSEIGNIFPLGTKFSEAFSYDFDSEDGERKPVIMASYGIGSSRIMGVIAEKFHDAGGVVWPNSVAPFQVYLAGLNTDDEGVQSQVKECYQELLDQGIEVLFDDRDVSAGEKLADADLIGASRRVVISRKTEGKLEVKRRSSDEVELLDLPQLIKQIKS